MQLRLGRAFLLSFHAIRRWILVDLEIKVDDQGLVQENLVIHRQCTDLR